MRVGSHPAGAVRLFCLPYAGASAAIYHAWRRELPSWIEVCPLELPGRGQRYAETPQQDAFALAASLARQILGQLDRPYAVFGHSMGALLAYELGHALRALRVPTPLCLFVSGCPAPARRERQGRFTRLSDAELLATLQELEGTPPELLADPELMALFLPVLRADFQLCASYEPVARPPLDCALGVFAGRADACTADASALLAWRTETTGAHALELLDGGHFFLHEQRARLLAALQRQLAEAWERDPALQARAA